MRPKNEASSQAHCQGRSTNARRPARHSGGGRLNRLVWTKSGRGASKSGSGAGRKGTAVAELAVCLPVVVLVFLATMEACTMLFVQQKLKTTAFEGARIGIVPKAAAENVVYQCGVLLDAQKVRGYSIKLDPPKPESLSPGDYFTVTVEAPCGPNSLIGGWVYEDKLLSKSVALRAE